MDTLSLLSNRKQILNPTFPRYSILHALILYTIHLRIYSISHFAEQFQTFRPTQQKCRYADINKSYSTIFANKQHSIRVQTQPNHLNQEIQPKICTFHFHHSQTFKATKQNIKRQIGQIQTHTPIKPQKLKSLIPKLTNPEIHQTPTKPSSKKLLNLQKQIQKKKTSDNLV